MTSMLGAVERLQIGPNIDGLTCRATDTPVALSRDKLVNRLLDWAQEARLGGREERAEMLLALAWEAYDR